jgi:predicted GNAT family acetyltransferase
LDPFLLPSGACPAIGAETTVRTFTGADGIVVAVLASPHGSTRYLAMAGDAPVSVLQVVSRDGHHARIANAFTVRERQRTGLARMLLAAARADFDEVLHSDDLSDHGRAFAAATR